MTVERNNAELIAWLKSRIERTIIDQERYENSGNREECMRLWGERSGYYDTLTFLTGRTYASLVKEF